MPSSHAGTDDPIAIIGGGITGLSAAFELTQNGRRVELIEQGESLGGKIAQTSVDGSIFPTGPDAFLARRPEVTALAEDLGLGDSLTSPVARAARIYRNGVLHPLPPNVLGVPATTELATTGLISPEGQAVAVRGVEDDPAVVGDESVGALVRRQLGDEVLEFLVDPLLGGINAGDSDQLSVVSGVPQLDTLRKRGGRLLDAAAATIEQAAQRSAGQTAGKATGTDPAPVFHSIEGGLGRLVDQLAQRLDDSGLCTMNLNTRAELERAANGWLVNGIEFEHVISTIPAFGSAEMIRAEAPEAARLLDQIEYSSVALTVLTLAPDSIPIDASISGVLVPRSLGHHVTAVSFASHKWPALAVGGRQVLRVSVGRRTDNRWQELTDEALVEAIERDLTEIFAAEVRATDSIVTRWNRALPQYDVGHQQTIEALDSLLNDMAGVHLTGAWRDGLGLPACVAAGRQVAHSILGILDA